MINILRRRTPAPAPAEPVDPLAAAEAAEADALAAEADARRRAVLAEAAVADAEAAAKLDAIRHRAEIDRRRRERKAAADEARDAEAASVAQDAARRRKRSTTAAHVRKAIGENSARLRRLAVNVVVNGGAGYGQFRFFHVNLGLPVWAAVMLAAGLELVAVTVLDYGIAARRAGRRYHAKFAAAALLASLVALINFTHWSSAPGLHALAIPSALLSLLGPPMWMWYADARHAETAPVLQLDERAASTSTVAASTSTPQHAPGTAVAQFDLAQWLLWFPTTFAAKRQAVLLKITDADEAMRAARQHLDAKAAARAVKIAAREQAKIEKARRKELESSKAQPPNRYLPTPGEVAAMSDEEKREAARDGFRTAKLDGVTLTAAALAEALGMSESWARARIREVREVLRGEIDDTDDTEQAQ